MNREEDGTYSINQASLIRKIAKTYDLEQAKRSNIPMDTGYYKARLDSRSLPNNVEYHCLIGSLLYIATNSRPDIAASVSILSRRINNPLQADWVELKRIVRYLCGTMDYRLFFDTGNLKLEGFSDADWASDTADRKSNSGFVFLLGGAAVSWGSRKQACVSTSTMEAEYVALAEAGQEAVWLRRLLADLNEEQHGPTIVWEDNKSCLDFATLEKQNRRSKHIDTKYHYVRELVSSGEVALKYCPTDDMLADIMTKPVGATKVRKFSELLGLQVRGVSNR